MLLRRLRERVRGFDWFAVAVEFVIVVLGVYVAVWVGDRQRLREQKVRTDKVVAALRQDLRDSIAVGRVFDHKLNSAFAAFDAARSRGEMPPPVFLRLSRSDTPPKSPCEGVFRAGLAELMDPALLWDLCFYYDERDGTGRKFVRYTVFTENEILPRLKGDPRAFYTSDGRNLAPAFASHVDRLQEWRRDSAVLDEWAQCLDVRLGQASLPGPSCRPKVGGTIDTGGR